MLNLFYAILTLAVFVAMCRFLLTRKTFKVAGIILLILAVIGAAIFSYITYNESKQKDVKLKKLLAYNTAITSYADSQSYSLATLDESKFSDDEKARLKIILKDNPTAKVTSTNEIIAYAKAWSQANGLYTYNVSGNYYKQAVHLEKPLDGVSDVQIVANGDFISTSEALELVQVGVTHSYMFDVFALDGKHTFDYKSGKWEDLKPWEFYRFRDAL
ncbi:hypothetical protein [Hafnia alvei]|uniref:hypothetical protein n=1 Tax=Hafnia alvei TaxID=569 RepID=UPI0010339CCC|nr:hypothetical protein [Hafnia alvei]TBM15323.1 hypothetical protein EYY84_08440 [Hafnia alvei]